MLLRWNHAIVYLLAAVWSCDFEQDCPYEQDTEDDFDWSVHQGPTSTRYTVPDKDHTKGDKSGEHCSNIIILKISMGHVH